MDKIDSLSEFGESNQADCSGIESETRPILGSEDDARDFEEADESEEAESRFDERLQSEIDSEISEMDGNGAGNGVLSPDEESELFLIISGHGAAAGDAVAEIFRRNQGLVKHIANRYRKRDGWLSFDDLVLEGNIGLLTAIRRFDPDRGYRFSTYAYGVIKGRVQRAQNKDPRVVKPLSTVGKGLLELMDLFYLRHQREPRNDAELLEFSEHLEHEDGGLVWDSAKLKRAAKKLRQSGQAWSLDAPLDVDDEGDDGGDGSASPSDFQQGEEEVSADDLEDERELVEKIKSAIEEAYIHPDVASLLAAFLDDPYGPRKDDELGKLIENLGDDQLFDALKEGGLLE